MLNYDLIKNGMKICSKCSKKELTNTSNYFCDICWEYWKCMSINEPYKYVKASLLKYINND